MVGFDSFVRIFVLGLEEDLNLIECHSGFRLWIGLSNIGKRYLYQRILGAGSLGNLCSRNLRAIFVISCSNINLFITIDIEGLYMTFFLYSFVYDYYFCDTIDFYPLL